MIGLGSTAGAQRLGWGRRGVLAAVAALPLSRAAAALPTPRDGTIAFDVFRLGSRIGTHVLHFAADADAVAVRIDVDLVVRFALIPVFRYTQRATERWEGGLLAEFAARTDRDGEMLTATGRRMPTGTLQVEGTKAPRYLAPAEALTTTYWNRRLLDVPMISTQDGRLFRPAVTDIGSERISVARGGEVAAEHYSVIGTLRIDVWYAQAGWIGFAFTAKDGSVLTYTRI